MATTCPFLVPVIADRLWLYPVSAYCRRPEGALRVPGNATLARLCSTRAHVTCEGFRAAERARAERATARGDAP